MLKKRHICKYAQATILLETICLKPCNVLTTRIAVDKCRGIQLRECYSRIEHIPEDSYRPHQ